MLTEGSLTAVAAFELVATLLCVSLNEGNYTSFKLKLVSHTQ